MADRRTGKAKPRQSRAGRDRLVRDGDVATASLLEAWIDEVERRVRFRSRIRVAIDESNVHRRLAGRAKQIPASN